MTDLAKAVEIAKRWLTNSVDENFRYFDFNDAAVLAKAFLALREKCEKMETAINACRKIVEYVHPYRERDWHLYPTRLRDRACVALSEAGFKPLSYNDCEAITKKALEHGEADG